MEFDLENPLTDSRELYFDTVSSLFLVEVDHMPSMNYLKTLKAVDFDVPFRREAIYLISRVSHNYDPCISYLAVNYLDRFLSSQEMLQPKPWVLRLLAVSCVSLAAKMKKAEASLLDIQVEGGLVFDTQTVQRMEAVILDALKWRMRSITPFSFIPFFISLFKYKDPPSRQALKARAIGIILKAQNDAKLLEFRPSVIAASALLSASQALFPLQFSCFRKAVSNCSYVNKENMLQCYLEMHNTSLDGYGSLMTEMASSSDTPDNVLDRQDSSSGSEKIDGTITSTTSSHGSTITSTDIRDLKRRKMSGFCNNAMGQVSQMHAAVLMRD